MKRRVPQATCILYSYQLKIMKMCQLRNIVYLQLPKKKIYHILLSCAIFGVCYVTMEKLFGSSLHDHEDEFWRLYADDPFSYGSK
ncbi:hypothetical protein ScPMuIL_000951 [Solemya velum]